MAKNRGAKARKKPPQLTTQDLPILRQARSLWKQNKLIDALHFFEKAVRENPTNAMALTDASRAFGAFYRLDEAEQLLDRLVNLAGRRPDLLQLAGQSFRLLRRNEKAVACFQSALSLDASLADSHLELAMLLERDHKLEKSLEHLDNRLRLLPGDAEARLMRGRVLRRQSQYEESELVIRKVCDTDSAFWMTRSRACAELAAVYDSQAEYDNAWQAMMRGKEIARPFSNAAIEHRNRLVPPLVEICRNIHPDTLLKWSQREKSAASDHFTSSLALLTGLPRSGTTLLEVNLSQQARIHCFDEFDAFPGFIFPSMLGKTKAELMSIATFDDLDDTRLERMEQSYRRWLLTALSTADGSSDLHWTIDKNPSLLLLIPIYLRLVPNAKFLVALRDPRDILVSCMMTYFPLNDFSVDFLDLESGANRIATDLQSWAALREHLPGNWCEIRYEDFVTETDRCFTTLTDFLQLESGPSSDSKPGTESLCISAPSYEHVAKPIYSQSIRRWKHYESHLTPVLRILDSVCGMLGY